MNFTEIVAEILSTTGRPDKLSVIRREVNSAIAIFAQDGDFARCLNELVVAINPAEYTQAIAMSQFPRHRKFSYIKRAGTRQYLKKLDLANLAKNDCDLRDKYYVAGSNLNISMTTVASSLDVGYYQHPPILTDNSPDYWLLEGAWPAVLNRAAGKVFDDIGDPAEATRLERQAVAAWLGFRDNHHHQE